MGLSDLINQGKDIVHGHINEVLGLNKDISTERMKVCKTCPLFKNVFGGVCNPNLWLNPDTMDISNRRKEGYYKGCGCRISPKTKLVYAHCPAHRW